MSYSSRRAIFEQSQLIVTSRGSISAPAEGASPTAASQTKVIATLGSSSSSKEKICELLDNGVQLFRLDASNLRSTAWFADTLDVIASVAKEKGRITGVVIDMHGNHEVCVRRDDPSALRCIRCRRQLAMAADFRLAVGLAFSFLAPLEVPAEARLTLTVEEDVWSPGQPFRLPLARGERLLDSLEEGDMLHGALRIVFV
jgi:hypothetical protein